jgi:uncharacterized protein
MAREVTMDCPVCENPMITMELDEVEIDHCQACGGIWLDAGELRLLLGDPVKASALLASFHPAGAAEDPRKCPICLHRMEKVRVTPDDPNLLIDRCRKHGLWFDKGELTGIIKIHSFDAEHKVEKMLADIFGTEQQGEQL